MLDGTRHLSIQNSECGWSGIRLEKEYLPARFNFQLEQFGARQLTVDAEGARGNALAARIEIMQRGADALTALRVGDKWDGAFLALGCAFPGDGSLRASQTSLLARHRKRSASARRARVLTRGPSLGREPAGRAQLALRLTFLVLVGSWGAS